MATVKRCVYFHNTLAVIVASCYLLVGPTLSDDETYHQDVLYQPSYNKSLKEQLTRYNPNIELNHFRSVTAEQANEDFLAIEQAYKGYQEILAREKKTLSKEPDYDGENKEVIEQMDGKINSNIEDEENINDLQISNPDNSLESSKMVPLKSKSFTGVKDNTYRQHNIAHEASHTLANVQCGCSYDRRKSSFKKGHQKSSPKDRPKSPLKSHPRTPKDHPNHLPKGHPKSPPKGHPRTPKGSPKSPPKDRPKTPPKSHPRTPKGRPRTPKGRPRKTHKLHMVMFMSSILE